MEHQQSLDELKSSKYKIWGYKYDLAEINYSNYKIVFKQYFQMSTKKISLLGSMLAINILFTIISVYVIHLIPGIYGFLYFEISFFTVLIVLTMTNLFYSIFFLELTIWMRLLFGANQEPVGLLAMNITDLTFLILFAFLLFLLKLLIIKLNIKNSDQIIRWSQIPIAIIVAISTSGIAILINYAFILDLYNVPTLKIKAYYIVLLWFNIAKYLLNFIMFFSIYKVLITLIKNYKI